jgi:ribokinase
MNHKIVVVGSTNIDLFMKVQKIPKPGETVIGKEVYKYFGGKGANQAIAAARFNGDVTFIGSLGNDSDGLSAIKNFSKEGIDISNIKKSPHKPTGLALIFVDEQGENSIAVSSGANELLGIDDITACTDIIKKSDILLIQLEIPIETVKVAAKIAYENNVKVILNPAPAFPLDDELYSYVSIITPNIHETESLTGIKVCSEDDALKASTFFIEKGIETVIITNGANGVYNCNQVEVKFYPAHLVSAIDTTGAGDIFNGVLASAIAYGMKIEEAVEYATAAAAISVTFEGAQNSAPTKSEVDKFLLNKNLNKSFINIKGVQNEKV